VIPLDGCDRKNWAKMSDDQIIQYAQSFIKEKRIAGRWELSKADPGLYVILNLRNLLSIVFSDIEKTRRQSLERELLSGLLRAPEAMEKFGEGK